MSASRPPHVPDPPLAAAAHGARRLTHLGFVLAVAVAIWALSSLVGAVVSRDPAGSALNAALAFLPTLVVAYGVRLLLVWAWLARYERRRLSALFRVPGGTVPAGRWRGPALAGGGAIAAAVAFGLVVAVLAALGMVSPAPGVRDAAAGGAALLAVGWIVQGTAEEVLYRGFVLVSVGARYGWTAGVAVSSGLFAVLHLQALGSPVALLNLLLFGVFAALLTLRTGTLWAACGFHAAWNFTQGNGLGIAVSGTQVPGGALWDLDLAGNTVLTGGQFGPEGSVVVTALLAVAVAVVLRWRPAGNARARVAARDSA